MEATVVTGHVPKVEIPPNGDFDSQGDEKALVLRPCPSPKVKFKRLIIGGQGYDEKYTKDDLSRVAKEAEEQLPEKFLREWTDGSSTVLFRAQGHKDAIKNAVYTMNTAYNYPRLVIYADGSTKDSHSALPKVKISGFGITYKLFNINLGAAVDNDWTDASYGVHGIMGSGAVEALAIHRSLYVARYLMERLIQQSPKSGGDHKLPPRVIIMSDCLGAINYIYSCHHYGTLGRPEQLSIKHRDKELPDGFMYKAYQPISRLTSLGISVEVNWIPGHSGLEGNMRADRLANIGANYISGIIQDNPSLQEGLFPVQIQAPGKERKAIPQVDTGNAATDLVYWQKQKTQEMVKNMLEARTGNPPKKACKKKRKRSSAAGDDSNIMDPAPPTKKAKLSTDDSTETQAGTSQGGGPTVRGLICWK
ncbi:uncharacterized protein F4807DRAFT_462409 [Annulohypoxylon truncatum]|uniref:uncharacterized protein n=1 Tax=Annulohypoxylon truncatum TaxID=327061 RepID=UPI002007B0A8|nr:uncharacterized protein F4807DRAFT_462409 [Annulohypoxylon truncatum]KAI1207600.1 hypothetical protein F4807DRAFT_462409 [Annulohypoxylon truncatum]